MRNVFAMAAVAVMLAACASEDDSEPVVLDPDVPVDGEEGEETPQVAVLGDISGATYDPVAEELTVQITLDGDTQSQVYTRDATYDVPGYEAYVQQDDPLDRFFTAFGGQSSDGSTTAVLAMDGGQFNRYFGGAVFGTTGYSAPASGLASYAGTYAGLSNVSTRDGTAASSADPQLLPERSIRTTGDVFINADFTDNQVNGAIINRQALDGATMATPDLVLIPTAIGADGSFAGTVEDAALEGLGQYSGIFGGAGASAVAGGVYITEYDDALEGEEERGIFVLDRCPGGGGGASQCFDAEGIND